MPRGTVIGRDQALCHRRVGDPESAADACRHLQSRVPAGPSQTLSHSSGQTQQYATVWNLPICFVRLSAPICSAARCSLYCSPVNTA